MRTPIIITAYNEQEHIGSMLNRLPEKADPIVVANGCTDDTVNIVRDFGIEPIVLEEQSKMLALQTGIKSLGTRAVRTGFVVLDADTLPVFPNAWESRAHQLLAEFACVNFCGPLIYDSERGLITSVIRSTRGIVRDINANIRGTNRLYGANMGIRPTLDALDQLLELPVNLWPGEDRAIRDILEDNGAEYKLRSDPHLMVMTSARSHSNLAKRVIKGKDWVKKESTDWYASKAPTDSQDYEDWKATLVTN